MECGQYNECWAAGIHMMPEETVQAHLDVAREADDSDSLGSFHFSAA
jgi:hypothetical protein